IAGGVPPAAAAELARVLGQAVDLQRELPPGARFTVLFERVRDAAGGWLRDGAVLHAGFTLAGRSLDLWHYPAADGAEWFDAAGRSLDRAFLRTPLDGAEVTSGFGQRTHPILGFTRMHQGVDFAAPRGTPVFAAADGVVICAGQESGYGRIIRLRHPDGEETRYAHLSGFAAGLRRGTEVRQGEVIGRVGSSGLATGPHLHFELRRNDVPVDPALAGTEPRVTLAGAELAAFRAARQRLARQEAALAPQQEVALAPELAPGLDRR
ncbi:MAG TPA: M23 family metallopeptidase, partial [Crenalkalicoccus sp.]|nr:M23 family metallopeptidase [Crenalkalicoccus sp.]